MPEYFHEAKKKLQVATNALVSFLADASIICCDKETENFYIKESVFKDAFFDYCEHTGFKKPTWSDDLYSAPFGQAGIIVMKLTDGKKMRYPRDAPGDSNRHRGTFFLCCDLVSEDVVSIE